MEASAGQTDRAQIALGAIEGESSGGPTTNMEASAGQAGRTLGFLCALSGAFSRASATKMEASAGQTGRMLRLACDVDTLPQSASPECNVSWVCASHES